MTQKVEAVYNYLVSIIPSISIKCIKNQLIALIYRMRNANYNILSYITKHNELFTLSQFIHYY